MIKMPKVYIYVPSDNTSLIILYFLEQVVKFVYEMTNITVWVAVNCRNDIFVVTFVNFEPCILQFKFITPTILC